MNHKKKSFVLIISLVMLCCITIGGTVAFLVDKTDAIPNTFTPEAITTEVDEKIEGGVKTYVKVKNTSNIDAYIRAMVIVTWQNDSGEIYSEQPILSEHYEATYNTTDWFENDGFYYHKTAVAAGASTNALITNCKLKAEATPPEGYKLCVEIIGSGIQADYDGSSDHPAKDAWGVTVNDNGTISG